MGPWSLDWLRGKAAKATVAKMAGAAVRGNVITEVVVDRQTDRQTDRQVSGL